MRTAPYRKFNKNKLRGKQHFLPHEFQFNLSREFEVTYLTDGRMLQG
jgi:hypothetical protein